jgi:hypothetical protein
MTRNWSLGGHKEVKTSQAGRGQVLGTAIKAVMELLLPHWRYESSFGGVVTQATVALSRFSVTYMINIMYYA